MAINEKRSYTEYIVAVEATDFAIGFKDYQDGKDAISVTVDGVDAVTAGYTVTRISDTVVQLDPAVPVTTPNHVVRLQRETNIDSSFHIFSEGAKFNATSMDQNFEQILHSQQESRDGYNQLSDRVVPLVDGLEDALQQASDASQAAQDAAAAAEEAAQVTRSTSQVEHANGETQKQIDDYIGATWYARVGGYGVNDKARLSTGEVVVSTIPSNTNDPNSAMTGWEYERKFIDFSMFGADPTGTISADTAIIAAFNLSRATGRPVVNNKGTYLVTGSTDIELSDNFDLTGTLFKGSSTFNASFKFTRKATTTTYTSGAIFDLIKSQGVLPAGKSTLSVLTSNPILDNTYIKIYTSQPMYNYRGAIENRFELARIMKRGQMLGSFMFPLDFALITRIDVQPVADTVYKGKGFALDETSIANNVTLTRVCEGNSFHLEDFKFIDKASAVATNTKNKISLDVTAHDIRVDYVDTSAVYINSTNDSNYTVVMGENYLVDLRNICSDGYGWGATGGNNCRNVKISNSKLNRIDFHKPCHELLQIDDCAIGNWGVLLTMLGDCVINNPRFNMRSGYNSNGYIRSRDDTGGFCNGNLTINNPTFDGDTSLSTVPYFRCQRGATNPLPSGTPIRAEFWTNIEVNGMKIHNDVISDYLDSNQGSDRALMPPRSIKLNGITVDSANTINLYFNRFALRPEGVRLIINDAQVDTLNLLDNDNIGTKIDASITGCRPYVAQGMTIANRCDGNFSFNDCKVMQYREFSSVYSAFTPNVSFNGGYFNNTTNTTYFDCVAASYQRIQANGMRLTYGDTTAMRNDLHYFSANACTWNNNAKNFPLYSGGGSASTTTFTLPIGGDVTLQVQNNSGKIDTITVSTSVAATAITLPNVSGTITTTLGSTMSIQVNASNLLRVGMVSS